VIPDCKSDLTVRFSSFLDELLSLILHPVPQFTGYLSIQIVFFLFFVHATRDEAVIPGVELSATVVLTSQTAFHPRNFRNLFEEVELASQRGNIKLG